MVKRIITPLLLMLFGTFAGTVMVELSLDVIRGNPQTSLYRDNKSYFEYEVYNPLFRKGRDREGRLVYFTKRNDGTMESFARQKPPSLKRIIVIGESTAGTFSKSKNRFREVLKEQIPSCDFEIIDCSRSGYDSPRIIPVAEEVVRYSPDLLLIFMGNNLWDDAFIKDFWLSNVFFKFLYERSWIVREVHARLLRTGSSRAPAVDRNTRFRNDYERIVRLAKARGIPVILFRLPANFRDFPPVNSWGFFNRRYMLIRQAVEREDYRGALTLLSEMKTEQEYASDPYTYFMTGKVLEKLDRFAPAKEMYLASLSLDATPGSRCDPVRNGLISGIAGKYDCPVVAIDALFAAMAPHGLLGDEYFLDNCHWLTPLNDLIIQETVRQIYAYNGTHRQSILADNARWQYVMPFIDPRAVHERLREEHAALGQTLYD
jgi:hypothetical protein